MRILIGAVISRYLPGEVLHRAQYVEGLRHLGHEVFWIEELSPEGCVDARGRPTDYSRCVNRERFLRAMDDFDLDDHGVQVFDGGRETVGLDMAKTRALARSSDLLLNFSGHVRNPDLLASIPRRAYLDSDPVFTQLWASEYDVDLGFRHHDVFFTRGANLAAGRSPIPTAGLRWHAYMPPLVLDRWPRPRDREPGPFTTVAAWGRYGDLAYEGEWYRSKELEFRRFGDLPRVTSREFRLALAGREYDPETAEHLVARGWRVEDGRALDSIEAYLGFIRGSGAEIGVAKHAYVAGRAGWFSERSTQYMACEKPVLVQDTGLDSVLPTGRGLLTFASLEEAAAGVEAILSDYERHARAARELAEDCFDHEKRLGTLLEACFSTSEEASPHARELA